MEEIIKKAIEGGYIVPVWFDTHYQGLLEGDTSDEFVRYIVLDRRFWQALGKACGWKDYGYMDDLERHRFVIGWEDSALKFHKINLTENFDKAVEYLKELTK